MKLFRLNECLLTFSARTERQEGAMLVYTERSAFHGVARDAIMESIYVDQTGQDSGKDSDSGLEIDPRAGRSTWSMTGKLPPGGRANGRGGPSNLRGLSGRGGL